MSFGSLPFISLRLGRGGVVVVLIALVAACGSPAASQSVDIPGLSPDAPAVSAAAQTVGPALPPGPIVGRAVLGMSAANEAYLAYAADILQTLSVDAAALRADLARSDLSSARRDWLAAQLDWERVGASYDSFGTLGLAVDGLPDGLPLGVSDPGFTGLHRLEYGLWHGQSAAILLPFADRLEADVAAVAAHLDDSDLAGNPTNLALRVHEILEDALRDHLSGIDDEGAGAAYAETLADIDATRAVLEEVEPLLQNRSPRLVETAMSQMDLLAASLEGAKQSGQWFSPAATPLSARQRIDAAIGQLLETLAVAPGLLNESD